MEFCEGWIDRINNDNSITSRILFSDESTFYLNGSIHKQNVRIWAQKNPRKFDIAHSQYPEKINVWLGILGNKIIGPYFIEGNLNQDKYLDLLITEVGPAIADYPGSIIFQQDGAPAHSTKAITGFLNETFPNSWIGRYGPYNWPARSPDLSPLDFYLWGFLGQKVYNFPKPTSLEELKQKLIVECDAITARNLQNSRKEFENRLGYCLTNFGGHFEHLI
jgi:hypothetical protein